MQSFSQFNDIFEVVLNTDMESVVVTEEFLSENAQHMGEDVDPRAIAIVSEHVDLNTLTFRKTGKDVTREDLMVLMMNAHCSPIGEEIVSYVEDTDLER